jgi:citronellol/citronellal dehydrogenase
MKTPQGKTILVTGASRGIGLAIAFRYAEAGANIVIISKDSPTALQEAKAQMIGAGGQALALDVDVTDPSALKRAVDMAVSQFGGIDVLVNNTSATCFTNTLQTTPEKFDLALATSVRAAYFLSQACFPYLKKSSNPHIINISPPLTIDSHWFKDYLAFSIGKYAMSFCTLGMAEEFKKEGIAVNSLWPKSTIASQTIKDHFDPKVFAGSRWPSIMGDAAYELLSRKCTGRFYTDEELLKEAGVVDFSHYAVDPKVPLMQALFIPADSQMRPVSQDLFIQTGTNK